MEHMEKVYKGLSRQKIEEQYMLRNTRPGYETIDIPRWKKLSTAFRAKSSTFMLRLFHIYDKSVALIFF